MNRQTTQEHSGSSQLCVTALASPVREWLPAGIRSVLSEAETSQLIVQIAVIIGVLMGFRAHVFEELANAQAFVWGITASVAAAVWLISRAVCQAGDQNIADTRMTFLLQFFATTLLYVAGLFWMTTGYYFGQLVGEVVGGRFGHITPDGGAIVGTILGACRAASFFVNRKF